MNHIREERDGDCVENYVKYSDYKTALNTHLVFCAACAKGIYVDDERFENFNRAIDHSVDNQILCENCLEEYNVLAHADR